MRGFPAAPHVIGKFGVAGYEAGRGTACFHDDFIVASFRVHTGRRDCRG
jgi:hypothetical protein